jgi:hypothetical protein
MTVFCRRRVMPRDHDIRHRKGAHRQGILDRHSPSIVTIGARTLLSLIFIKERESCLQSGPPSIGIDGKCAAGWQQRTCRGVQAADLMSIFLVWAGAGLGTVTFNTPFDITALMLSGFTPSGSWTARVNEP